MDKKYLVVLPDGKKVSSDKVDMPTADNPYWDIYLSDKQVIRATGNLTCYPSEKYENGLTEEDLLGHAST